jgi:hypothetical protein
MKLYKSYPKADVAGEKEILRFLSGQPKINLSDTFSIRDYHPNSEMRREQAPCHLTLEG